MSREMTEWEKQVRKALIDKGMTCTDLARKLGISRVYLYDILISARNASRYRAEIDKMLGIVE